MKMMRGEKLEGVKDEPLTTCMKDVTGTRMRKCNRKCGAKFGLKDLTRITKKKKFDWVPIPPRWSTDCRGGQHDHSGTDLGRIVEKNGDVSVPLKVSVVMQRRAPMNKKVLEKKKGRGTGGAVH